MKATTECDFLFQDYPFDVQNCFMNFRLKKPTRNEAVLNLNAFVYSGEEDLLEYRVMNTSVQNEFACGKVKLNWQQINENVLKIFLLGRQDLASCSR